MVSHLNKGSKKTASDPWKGEGKGAGAPEGSWGILSEAQASLDEAPINACFKRLLWFLFFFFLKKLYLFYYMQAKEKVNSETVLSLQAFRPISLF